MPTKWLAGTTWALELLKRLCPSARGMDGSMSSENPTRGEQPEQSASLDMETISGKILKGCHAIVRWHSRRAQSYCKVLPVVPRRLQERKYAIKLLPRISFRILIEAIVGDMNFCFRSFDFMLN